MSRQAACHGAETVVRCDWANGDPLLAGYHDTEWGVPVHDDRTHFEYIVLDGAQAGLSWLTVLRKRERYRAVFAGFNPEAVARFDERDVDRLMRDPGIVRNAAKIRSAIANARAFLNVQEEFGSFDRYIWGFVDGATIQTGAARLEDIPARTPVSDRMSADLRLRGFTFVGSTICYAYMQAAGLVDDHIPECFRRRRTA